MDELLNLLREKYGMDKDTAQSVVAYMKLHPGARDAFDARDTYNASVAPGPDDARAAKAKAAQLDLRDKPKAPTPQNHAIIQKIMDMTGMSDADAAKAAAMLDEQAGQTDTARANAANMDWAEHMYGRMGADPAKAAQAKKLLDAGLDAYGRPFTRRSPFSPPLIDGSQNGLPAFPGDRTTTIPYGSPYEDKQSGAVVTVGNPNPDFHERILQAKLKQEQDKTMLQQYLREKNEKVSGVKMLEEYLHSKHAQDANEMAKSQLWSAAVPGSTGGNVGALGSGYFNELGVKVQ